jgi:hypothetical protein
LASLLREKPDATVSTKSWELQRVADGLAGKVIQEIKNVRYQAYTQQLRDYVQYATENGLTFELYLRAGTTMSDPLVRAVSAGTIRLLYYP